MMPSLQALLVGEHMLAAKYLVRSCILPVLFRVRWCWMTHDSSTPGTKTCLNVILLLLRSCKGPKCDHPDDRIYWNFWHFNPVVLYVLCPQKVLRQIVIL